MKALELIELLQEQIEVHGEDLEVLVAEQPSWPLVNRIANVWTDDEPVVWLATSAHEHNGSPYAPREAWQ
jgi:hypothetical protein